MAEVKNLTLQGYHDGYYWDLRAMFEYKDKKFVYIDVGSGSGYIPNYGAIAYARNDLLSRWDPCFEVDVNFKEEELIDAAEKLLASGEEELELWNYG